MLHFSTTTDLFRRFGCRLVCLCGPLSSLLAVDCVLLSFYFSDVPRSVFKHDPSKVAVCRSFLQNRCTDVSCPLCHTADPVRSYHAMIYHIFFKFLHSVLTVLQCNTY